MLVDVKVIPKGDIIEKLELENGSDGLALLSKLEFAPDVHIITKNKLPIPMDEILNDGDKLTIISVVSGG
jgi:sulfur carrier protein ThiS